MEAVHISQSRFMAMGLGQAPVGAEGEGVSERETGVPLLLGTPQTKSFLFTASSCG